MGSAIILIICLNNYCLCGCMRTERVCATQKQKVEASINVTASAKSYTQFSLDLLKNRAIFIIGMIDDGQIDRHGRDGLSSIILSDLISELALIEKNLEANKIPNLINYRSLPVAMRDQYRCDAIRAIAVPKMTLNQLHPDLGLNFDLRELLEIFIDNLDSIENI